MYDIERQNKIIEILRQKKSISVTKLTELLYISPATARRDLSSLEKRGVIKRTFGGAVIIEANNEESSVVIREQMMVKSKRYICEKAINFISNDQSIFLDSSSTVTNLVGFLNDFRFLSIITNGINVASQIINNANFKVILVGGEITARSNSTIGPTAIKALDQFHCDVSITSCSGIDIENGTSEGTVEQSEIKRMMMKNSDVNILLTDCSKFNKTYLSKTCPLNAFDVIITDQKPDIKYIEYCDSHDVKLLY